MVEQNHVDFEQVESKFPSKRPRSPGGWNNEDSRVAIPRLPKREVTDFQKLPAPTRMRAAVNLKLDGLSFAEIAELLELKHAGDARQLVEKGLSAMHPPEDAELLRRQEGLRAEKLFAQSLAMAQADYFVDADDPDVRIPNADKLRWHDQAAKDLALHAAITGAKAPTKVDVSTNTEEINRMVNTILEAGDGGGRELEADIWEVDEIPEVEDGDS
ncbi:MAG: hypothetical protein ACTHXC_00375 [Brachybacterium sp.]